MIKKFSSFDRVCGDIYGKRPVSSWLKMLNMLFQFVICPSPGLSRLVVIRGKVKVHLALLIQDKKL